MTNLNDVVEYLADEHGYDRDEAMGIILEADSILSQSHTYEGSAWEILAYVQSDACDL